MKRMWPDEYAFLLDNAEEVELHVETAEQGDGPAQKGLTRRALRVSMSQQDFERIWPLAEARYRLSGRYMGKAITLIANNPHYHQWHPTDGGDSKMLSDGGQRYATQNVIVHFLLDDVRETAAA